MDLQTSETAESSAAILDEPPAQRLSVHRAELLLQIESIVLCVVAGAVVLWASAVLTVEHYDGYEYLLSARSVWGDAAYFMPKSPLFIWLLAAIHLPLHFLHRPPTLAPYHFSLAVLGLAGTAAIAKWLQRRWAPELPYFVVLALCWCNAYVIAYAPFALSDVTIGLLVALWLWADLSFAFVSRYGVLWRTLALGLLALGRPQTVIIAIVCLGVDVVRSRCLWPAIVSIVGASAIYLIVSGALFARVDARYNLWTGAWRHLQFVNRYYNSIRHDAAGAWWEHPVQLARMSGPVALGLLAGGVLLFIRARRRGEFGMIDGMLLGSACFFGFLMWIGVEGSQYLLALFVPFVLLQSLALKKLSREGTRHSAIAMILPALLVWAVWTSAPWLCRKAFRMDLDRTLVQRVGVLSGDSRVVVLERASLGTFQINPEKSLDKRDCRYVSQFLPFVFYENTKPTLISPTEPGPNFPIPDHIQSVVPAGVPLVVSPRNIASEPDLMTPPYVLRWYPRDNRAIEKCDPRVQDVCVEVVMLWPEIVQNDRMKAGRHDP